MIKHLTLKEIYRYILSDCIYQANVCIVEDAKIGKISRSEQGL